MVSLATEISVHPCIFYLVVNTQGGHKPGKLREFEKLSKSQGKLREI